MNEISYQQAVIKLMSATVKKEASDLHLCAGYPPIIRVNDSLWAIPGEQKLSASDSQGMAFALMTEEQRQQFLKNKEIDFSYSFINEERFRVNVFYQKGFVSAALRLIPKKIRSLNELNLPLALNHLIEATQGFVMITGPSSHGKSTTLAALIDGINHQRCDHIITIEDPIEYIFEPDRSVIEQRELNVDTFTLMPR